MLLVHTGRKMQIQLYIATKFIKIGLLSEYLTELYTSRTIDDLKFHGRLAWPYGLIHSFGA